MHSLVVPLALRPPAAGTPAPQPTNGDPAPLAGLDALAGWDDADLVLGYLPPGDGLEATVAALGRRFPAARVAGCEAVTQFVAGSLAAGGVLHLFRFDVPGHGAEVEVVPGSVERPPDPARLAACAEKLAAGTPVLVVADGLRFPAEPALAVVRRELARRGVAGPPPVAGGLASQAEPIEGEGARVFADGRVFDSACLAVALSGVRAHLEVVRGWDPASPVYTVTRAAGKVLHEIEGEPAVDFYRRFFTVDGRLAPLPETSWRFPLIVEGPAPERSGLYRSMRFFDDPPGAVTLWGEVETGDRVRLGMGNEASLVARAAALAGTGGEASPEAAVLYSCVGREAVLGDGARREVAAVHRALGGVPLSGFFSFGEIGPTPAGGPAFYNHTAILVLLAEEEPAA
ncbi:MAG TPA: FIST C-terminal domain-containing protein [Thermoanaerobaculia bacterium]|nr:FIST C-terminal domain-containing protein [Thermoanaerobaculia bacterium]